MIEMGKEYKTRDGRSVRLLCIDGPDKELPVIGIGEAECEDCLMYWREDGAFHEDTLSGGALVECKPRIKREVWVNVYKDDQSAFSSEPRADTFINRDECIARVKLTIDCEHGEGL